MFEGKGGGEDECFFSYNSELEDMCELCVDLDSVWPLLPVVRHIVNLTKDSLHQDLRTPYLVLKISHTSIIIMYKFMHLK